MTSPNENIFHVTDPLCGESPSHQFIPITKTTDAEFWSFLWCAPRQTVEQTVKMPMIWDVIVVIMTSLQCAHTHTEALSYRQCCSKDVNKRTVFFECRWPIKTQFIDCLCRKCVCIMMTSSNGNVFRVTGHLCGEFTGPRWIPRTKASDVELWCFLWSASE